MSRIRRRSLVTPADLFTGSHNGFWCDGADRGSMFQLSTGATAVTAAADPIGYWTDKSGLGNHMKQATAGNRPTLHASFGVDFDNVAVQHLFADLVSGWRGTTLNAVVALIINSYATNAMRIISVATGAGNDYDTDNHCIPIVRQGTTSTLTTFRATGSYGTTPGLSLGIATKARVETSFNGITRGLRIGSTDEVRVASLAPFSFNRIMLGNHTGGGTDGPADITIAEVIMRNALFNSYELPFIRNYLDRKWAI